MTLGTVPTKPANVQQQQCVTSAPPIRSVLPKAVDFSTVVKNTGGTTVVHGAYMTYNLVETLLFGRHRSRCSISAASSRSLRAARTSHWALNAALPPLAIPARPLA